jgi:hypothetical protein
LYAQKTCLKKLKTSLGREIKLPIFSEQKIVEVTDEEAEQILNEEKSQKEQVSDCV